MATDVKESFADVPEGFSVQGVYDDIPEGFTMSHSGDGGISFGDVNPVAGEDPSTLPGSISQGALMIRAIKGSIQAKGTEGADVGSLIGAGVALGVGQIPPFNLLPEEGLTIPFLTGLFGRKALSTEIGSLVGGGIGQKVHSAVNPYVDGSWSAIRGAVGRTAAEDVGGAAGLKGLGIAYRSGKAGLGRSKHAVFNALKKTVGSEPTKIIRNPTGPAARVGEGFIEKGGRATEAQLSNSLWSQLKDTVGRGGIGTKRMYAEFGEAGQADAARIAREAVATTDAEISQLGTDTFDYTRRSFGLGADGKLGPKMQQIKDVGDEMYDIAFKNLDGKLKPNVVKTGERMVPTGILDENGEDILKAIPINVKTNKIVGVGASTRMLKRDAKRALAEDAAQGGSLLAPEIKQFYTAVGKWPNDVPIDFLRTSRTAQLNKGASFAAENNPAAKGVRKITKQLDDAIFNNHRYTSNNPVELRNSLKTLRDVDQIYKTAKDSYEEVFAKSTADKLYSDPEQVIPIFGLDKITEGAPGPLSRIQRYKDTLTRRPIGVGRVTSEYARDRTGEVLWDRTQKAATAGVMIRSTKGGSISKSTIKTYMDGMGDKALNLLHGKDGVDALNKAMDLSDLVSDKGESLGLIIHGAQAAALVNAGAILYGNELDGKDAIGLTVAAGLLIGPRALARSMMNKDTKHIVEQLTTRKFSFSAKKRLISKLIGRLRQEDISEKNRMRRASILEGRRSGVEKQKAGITTRR